MPTVNVEFNGDASGVEGAAAAAQAAIDRVHGKDVSINIKTTGSRALGTAGKNMDQFGASTNASAAALERHARASERATSGARDHAAATERAGASTRDHASETERASSSTRAHSSEIARATGSLSHHAGASGDASRETRALGESHRYSRGEAQGLTRALVAGGLATAEFAKSASGLLDVTEKVGGGFGSAAKAGGGLEDVMGRIGSVGSTVGSTLTALGTAFAYGAAGSGILTAAVGALGVVGVGALGGVGVAAGLAGAGMAAFAADSLKDSAKFKGAFEQIGKTAHLASQYVSEPVGDAMVSMAGKLANNGALTQAGLGIANSLRDGFGTAAGVVTKNSDAIVEAAGEAAGGFAKLTSDAAPGVSAFLGQLPGLTRGAVSGISQIASEFGDSARQIEGATPSFNRMMSAAGGLGAELVHIGAGSITPFNEDMTSMTRTATRMANQLEPAIKPSMGAFTDLANAGMGAIGSLSPEIAGFANTVSQNSPQVQSALTAMGRGMLGLGTGAVEGLSQAGPGLDNLGASTERYAPAIGRDTGRAGGLVADFLAGAEQIGGWMTESGEGLKSGLDNAFGVQRNAKGGVDFSHIGAGDPGSAQGGFGSQAAVQHGAYAYTHPLDTAREVFGGGPANTVGAQRAAGMANQANAGGVPSGQVISAPVSAGLVGAGSGQVGAAGGHGFIGPVSPMPDATAGLFTGAGLAQHASAIQTIGAAAQAAHAPVQQLSGAMTSGAGAAGVAAPMMSSMTAAVHKTTQSATSAAEVGGASVGAALGGGVGAGITTTQTINDTIFRKHIVKVVDSGRAEGDIHSPSGLTRRRVGQPLGQGTALGVQDTFPANRDAAGGLLGHYANENKPAPVITIKGGRGAARAAQAGQGDPAAPLTGAAKQRGFGEDPGKVGANEGQGVRAVFDKGVQSWEAKPGVDITKIHDMGELNKSIQSPLSGKQYGAMVSMQGVLDQPGLSRNSQMFGQRTEQNIMRNRPGAFDVAGQWANHMEDQKDQAKIAGQNSADGVAEGFGSRHAMVSRAGAQVAKSGLQGYKKEDDQQSPSRKWSEAGGNSVAGAVGGVNAGIPAIAAAGAGMASTMQNAAVGPMSDSGLQIGYTWAENVATGAQSQLKTANFQAGTPDVDNEQIRTALAGTGSLVGYGGASVYKTPARSFDGNSGQAAVAALAAAIASQPVQVHLRVDLDGQPFQNMVVEGGNQLLEIIQNALVGANG